MSHRIYHVDAFTEAPFQGNPAAVCLLDARADPAWMQSVAREMNLSETAFVVPGPDTTGLRWFTPVTEVDLCGHATLAAAHILYETHGMPHSDPIRFVTQSGTLTITCDRPGKAGDTNLLHMDFPARPAVPTELAPNLLEALGIECVWTGASIRDAVIVTHDENAVRSMQPDLAALGGAADFVAVCVTAPADPRASYDFVCRVFAPSVGIDEDPVTGSIYATLGPFWSDRLGKNALSGVQASARGGLVHTKPLATDRVLISGSAITTLRGELLV